MVKGYTQQKCVSSFLLENILKMIVFPLKFPGSESDSADEPVVGNVNKFAVVPPGFSGRPKRGHLIFDACFECGS